MGLMPTPGQVPPEAAAEAKDPARYTDEADSNASPEEQAQYEQFVNNALELIYDKTGGELRPEILEALKSTEPAPAAEGEEQGQSPQPPHIIALANTAVMIVSKLDDSSREAGQPASDEVLMEVGKDVVELLVEGAEAAGLRDYTQDDMDGAFITAADMYRSKAVADGRTDEETLKGQWDDLITADQEGRLGEVIPGADKLAPPEQEA